MLLIDTELRLVWEVWNRLVRDETVEPYVFVSFCRGVASCDLQGKDISCQKIFHAKKELYMVLDCKSILCRGPWPPALSYCVTSLWFIWRSRLNYCRTDVHTYFSNSYTMNVQHGYSYQWKLNSVLQAQKRNKEISHVKLSPIVWSTKWLN